MMTTARKTIKPFENRYYSLGGGESGLGKKPRTVLAQILVASA
jgi:hypothetical protein